MGAGRVATRRIAALLAAGADDVTVIAPTASAQLLQLAADGRIRHLSECVQGAGSDMSPSSDRLAELLATAWLVHTATGVDVVDSAVADWCQTARIWCVRSDSAARSAAWVPAVARHDGVTLAVGGGGRPRRAMRVRDGLLGLLRSGLLPGGLSNRLSTSERGSSGRPPTGRVALVGGGPGNIGLLTLRGAVLLAEADVVVIDRLVGQDLLALCRPDVEVVRAGKAPGAHSMDQREIEHMLVERATAGQRVVRLKGGDPFVLGRGGEEVAACRAAGVPVEVVPGISSAIAAPAAAGIPVTHRGLARGFTVVSGHDSELDAQSLARLDGTLVVLMGITRLAAICHALMAAGKPADTPAAVVADATTAAQRTVIGTLEDIAARVELAELGNPAVLVIGDVVTLADPLNQTLDLSNNQSNRQPTSTRLPTQVQAAR